MPYYAGLRKLDPAVAERASEGLIRLKKALAKEIPPKTFERNVLIATWNIREFGAAKYGPRQKESLYYIAEIINRFDLVAVQEVRKNIDEFNQVMNLLGSWWKPLYTDVTVGTQGNSERTAFLYDSRKLSFKGLAGEVTLPPKKVGKKYEPVLQFARSPYIAGFQAGWFRFSICTTHLFYGLAKPDDPQRVREMEELAGFLAKLVKDDNAFAKNMVLLGDFNIFTLEDDTFKRLEKHGFKIPAQVRTFTTNLAKGKHYDQIAFIAPSVEDQLAETSSGAFDFSQEVFRNSDEAMYKSLNTSKAKYGQWRTYEISDHLPLWVELKVDFSESYLQQFAKGGRPAGRLTTTPPPPTAPKPRKTVPKKRARKPK